MSKICPKCGEGHDLPRGMHDCFGHDHWKDEPKEEESTFQGNISEVRIMKGDDDMFDKKEEIVKESLIQRVFDWLKRYNLEG